MVLLILSTLSYCCYLVVDLLISVIFYTVLSAIFLPLTIYKTFVIFLAKILSPDLVHLSSLDALVAHDFTRFSPKNNLPYKFNEGAAFTIVGDVNVETLRNILQNFLNKISRNEIEFKKYLRLRSTFVIFGGYGFFKPLEKIDFKISVQEETCPIPTQKFNEYKCSWITQPFVQNSPLWEFRILPKDKVDETILLFKAHHSILDGNSMFYLLNVFFGDNCSEPTSLHEEAKGESLLEKISCALRFPRIFTNYHIPLLFTSNTIPISASPVDDFVIASTHIYFSDLKKIYQKKFPECCHKMVGIITPLPFTNHPTRKGKLGNHYCPVIIKVRLDKNKSISEMVSDVDQAVKDCYAKKIDKMTKWFVLPILSTIPVKIGGFFGELSILVSGLKLHFTTNIAYYSAECAPKNYAIAGCPILKIEPIFARPSDNIVLSGATVSHGDRCELTLLAIHEFVKTKEAAASLLTDVYLNSLNQLKVELIDQ